MVSRAVPNIKSERTAETREFFVELLGFEVAMDMGCIVTVASPTNPSVQVNRQRRHGRPGDLGRSG